jgi:hypothetical protein
MIKEKLTKSEANLQKLVDKFNTLEAEKQETLKEVLRLEGEIRVLKELIAKEK